METIRRRRSFIRWFLFGAVLFFVQAQYAARGVAQTAPPDPTPSIATPADARQFEFESLHTALAKDGGVPLPNLTGFVRDMNSAIRLGKALFWDMQVGSDGVQACASCHFAAGADS